MLEGAIARSLARSAVTVCELYARAFSSGAMQAVPCLCNSITGTVDAEALEPEVTVAV